MAIFDRSLCLAFFATLLVLLPPTPGYAQRVMPVGDSNTRGVPAAGGAYRSALLSALESGGYTVDFIGGLQDGELVDPDHEGHAGWTADAVAASIYAWLEKRPADVVILDIGANDLLQGLGPEAAALSIDQLLDEIDAFERDYGHPIVVVLACITNVDDPLSELGLEFSALNQEIRMLAAQRIDQGDRIRLVDLEPALDYPDDLIDVVHLSVAGYEKVAAALLPGVEEALQSFSSGESIGVAFTGSLVSGAGSSAVEEDDVMGVTPRGHWNATPDDMAAGSVFGLRGGSGFVHPELSVTWNFEGSDWSRNVPDATPEPIDANHKLMQGLLWSADSGGASVDVSGLDALSGIGGEYDVYVYFDAWDPSEGNAPHSQRVRINGGPPQTCVLDADYDAPEPAFDDATLDGSGNYARFEGLSGDSFTLVVDPDPNGANGSIAFLNGLQIVAPDPAPGACRDGVDNDGDGDVDYPDDQGCHTPSGYSELPDCVDGYDNDGDGLIDYPEDSACQNTLYWAREHQRTQCNDGLDNDADGLVDDADPNCAGMFQLLESQGCGMGAALCWVAPLLARWRAGRQSRRSALR